MPKKILAGVFLILLGFAIGWLVQFKRYEAKEWNYFLNRELSKAELSAIELKLLKEGNLNLLEENLWHQIELSLERSRRVIKFGATIPEPERYLRRVIKQAELRGHNDILAKVSVIKNALRAYD